MAKNTNSKNQTMEKASNYGKNQTNNKYAQNSAGRNSNTNNSTNGKNCHTKEESSMNSYGQDGYSTSKY